VNNTERELIRIERRSKELEQVLVSKEAEIGRLRAVIDQGVAARFASVGGGGNMGGARQQQQQDLRSGRPGGATSSDEFARSYEYLTGRMRDIDLKIRIILDGLQFRES
jgi:hypothetical protein